MLAAGRTSDAAALFMKLVGMPDDQLAGFRQSPAWGRFEGVAPTLAYDAAVVGDEADVPIEKAARVIAPALVMAGSAT